MTDEPHNPGLECPNCGCRHFYVVFTRQEPKRIRRERECRYCGRRVKTVERVTEEAVSPVRRPIKPLDGEKSYTGVRRGRKRTKKSCERPEPAQES